MRYRGNQKAFARALRQAPTDAEHHLWQALRCQSLGYKFRRQVSYGPYVVDFACLSRFLIVEVDGGQHAENPADRLRDEWLAAEGYQVLRFWNHEVLTNLPGVLEVIRLRLIGATPTDSASHRPPQGGGN